MNYFEPAMDADTLRGMSVLSLAHIGDGVYELLVRSLLCTGHSTANNQNLHRLTVSYVQATAQAAAVEQILPHLTEEEAAVYRRGRNAHTHTAPKNATPGQYARATGLETLFGWLFLSGRRERIHELFLIGMEAVHAL